MLENFQSLRFLFIITVFIAHFNYAGIEGKSTGIGVIFFFILSGFLMAKNHGDKISLNRTVLRKFYLRRIVKLYPIHLLCMACWLLLDLRISASINWNVLTANAMLLQSWIPRYDYYFSFNYVSWFLSDMIFLIICFPLIYRGIRKLSKRALAMSAAFMLVIYILYITFIPFKDLKFWIYIFPPIRLVDFTLGMMMWRACQLWPRLCLFRYASAAETSLLLLVFVSMWLYPLDPKWHISFIHWLVIVPLILIFWQGEQHGGGILSRIFHKPFLPRLGGYTMEVFMLQLTIIRIATSLASCVKADLPYAVMLALCLIATYLSAYILHTLFVKPVTKKLLKAITREQSPQTK